jgi:hypothetical protein
MQVKLASSQWPTKVENALPSPGVTGRKTKGREQSRPLSVRHRLQQTHGAFVQGSEATKQSSSFFPEAWIASLRSQ